MADSSPTRPRNIFNKQNDAAREKYASSSEDEGDDTSEPTAGPSGPGSGPPPPPPPGPRSDDDSDSEGGDDRRDGGAVGAVSDGMAPLSRTDAGVATRGEGKSVRFAGENLESTVSEPVRDASDSWGWDLPVTKPDATFVEIHLLRRWNSDYDEELYLRAAAVARRDLRAAARSAAKELRELKLAEEASRRESTALPEEPPSVASPPEIPLRSASASNENWQETARKWRANHRPEKLDAVSKTSSRASPAAEDSPSTRAQNESPADGAQSYEPPSAESTPESPVRDSATPITAKPGNISVPISPVRAPETPTAARTGVASVPTTPPRSASQRQSQFLSPPFSEYFEDPDHQSLAVEIKIELMLAPCKRALKYNKTISMTAQTQVKLRNIAASALGLAKEWELWIHTETIAKCHFYNGLTDLLYSQDDSTKRGFRARKHFNLAIRIARELPVSIDEELLASQWIEYIDDKPPRGRDLRGRRDHDDSHSDDDSARPYSPFDSSSDSSDTSGTLGRSKRAVSGSRPFSDGRPTTAGKSGDRPGTSYIRAAIPGLNQPDSDRPMTQASVASTVRPASLRPTRRTSLRTDILAHPVVGVRELDDADAVQEPSSPGTARESADPYVPDQISPTDKREQTAHGSASKWWPGEWFMNPFTNGKKSSPDTPRVSQRPHTTGTALEPWREDHTRDRPNSRQAAPRPLSSTATDSTSSAFVPRHYAEPPVRSHFEIPQRLGRTSSFQQQKDNDAENIHGRRRSRLGSVTTALSSWSRQAPRSPEALLEEGEHPAFSPSTSKPPELKSSTSLTFGDFPIPRLGNGKEVGETF